MLINVSKIEKVFLEQQTMAVDFNLANQLKSVEDLM